MLDVVSGLDPVSVLPGYCYSMRTSAKFAPSRLDRKEIPDLFTLR